MEDLGMSRGFWRGKKVFLTGHTGFKGGWLTLWLAEMGAEVYGYALHPPTKPSFFSVTGLQDRLARVTVADIRDLSALSKAMQLAQPDIVFHLAAQSLVGVSYADPLETYTVNVIGTINLLEAVRRTSSVKAVVNVTTDKCYENREWIWPYREGEALGGFDPYSSSKACSELVTAAYRRSFLGSNKVYLASARAGNVIGGGDWASDRLVPDFLRALDSGQSLIVRSPLATRPWQHVLEPLEGYLRLARKLFIDGEKFADAWNFGPQECDAKPVRWIVEYLCSQTPNASWQLDESLKPHEANMLELDSSKARVHLGWRQRWNLKIALGMTLSWHQAWRDNADMALVSLEQIRSYEEASSNE